MKQLALRLPDDVHTEMVEWAKREQRSLHAQILYLLQQALESERQAELKGSL